MFMNACSCLKQWCQGYVLIVKTCVSIIIIIFIHCVLELLSVSSVHIFDHAVVVGMKPARVGQEKEMYTAALSTLFHQSAVTVL